MLTKNNWERPIRIGRTILTKGMVADVPEHLLLQPRLQKLRKAKKLIFPYHKDEAEAPQPKPAELNKEPEVEVVKDVVAEEDLTQLAYIGVGRKKTLNSFGIFTFADVVERGDELQSLLQITAEQAADVVKDAESKVG
jgi:predicted flap endonuclease-1-like 5' DNA nuclease